MSRHIDIAKRGHGPCKTIYHNPAFDKPVSLADKVRAQILFTQNMEAMKLIDGPFQRGGFSPSMRHAR